ncbi:hypothetical protein NE237_029156 [Protea cynaroides]|uniref:Uncharacterized protein n=1 Tax=Protea cynaroides TaxID=273540 RepID=A0A9Q0JTJ3_9MAGN|nr:hypothetical protein NE237_029156 [Protea cynaroides]
MDALSPLNSSLHDPRFISSTVNKPKTIPYPQTPSFHASVRNEEKPHQQISSIKDTTTKARTTLVSTPTAIRRAEPNLLTTLFNTLDYFINNFIDPPLRPSVDPRYVLSGNFSPVDELPPTDCPVILGHLPSCLDGALLWAARVLAGSFNPVRGIGVANTSLAFFANRLFALCESDLPYAVRLTPEGDIETIGRHDFDGKLFQSMTAHPKTDPETGETFAFQCGLIISRVRSKEDFTDRSDPPYAKDDSEMRWFEVAGLNMMHAINAWDEEEDVIVLIGANIISVEHMLDRTDLVHGSVEKVRIDLRTGIVTRFPVSARNMEFGVINPGYVGKKTRYAYLGIGDPLPKISGVVKLDLSGSEHKERTIACRMFGEGCYGGEPFFVAKSREPGNSEVNMEAEDDGYVVTYMHNEITGESRFLVMDAKSPSLEIVAAVMLPRRVPYGFHGIFVGESDLQKVQPEACLDLSPCGITTYT